MTSVVLVLAWFAAATMATLAIYCYFRGMVYGMMAGDWIGLPRFQSQIAIAQRSASHWTFASALCQAGVAAAFFSTLRFGSEVNKGTRYVGRGIAAALLSLPLTFTVLALLFVSARLFGSHSR